MRKKSDMYIDYGRYYKKHSRKKLNWYRILLIVLISIGLGCATFYQIQARVKSENVVLSAEENTKKEALEKEQLLVQQTKNQQRVNELETEEASEKQTATEQQIREIVVTPTAAPQQEPVEVVETMDTRLPVKAKGIYVTSSIAGSNFLDSLVTLADTTEINCMVIDIKDDLGKITYKMDSKLAKEIGAVSNTISDIDGFVTSLKERDIYLIARIVAFKDPLLAEKRQELAIKNQDGSLYRDNNGEGWVNPYNHQVWEYLIEIATQAAAVGFDEIQFDYIRFSTGEGIKKVDFGEAAKAISKQDIIIEFTKYAYESLRSLGVYISADVYGTIISSSIDASLVGQNYVEMAKYLDYICPMIYPSHFGEGNYGIDYPDLEPFTIVRKVLMASQEKLDQIPEDEHRAIVRPWLQDFTATWIKNYMKYGAHELREQIGGVYGAGYEEWLLWNAGCKYSEDGLYAE